MVKRQESWMNIAKKWETFPNIDRQGIKQFCIYITPKIREWCKGLAVAYLGNYLINHFLNKPRQVASIKSLLSSLESHEDKSNETGLQNIDLHNARGSVA